MTMFLAEISFLISLALFAAGLVLWHHGRQATAGLLRGAGAVLVVGSVLTALCTGYFSVRYQVQGEFDHAYPLHPAVAGSGVGMMGSGTMMGPGGMGPGMMGPGMMGQRMPQGGAPGGAVVQPEGEPPGHAEHHPETGGKD